MDELRRSPLLLCSGGTWKQYDAILQPKVSPCLPARHPPQTLKIVERGSVRESIRLNRVVISLSLLDEEESFGQPWAFGMRVAGGKEFVFACLTEKEREAWMVVLRRALEACGTLASGRMRRPGMKRVRIVEDGDKGRSDLTRLTATFSAASFNAEKYVSEQFKAMGETAIKSHHHELEVEQRSSEKALRAKVVENYSRIIDVAQEVSNMEGDILELRNLLGEKKRLLKSVHGGLVDVADANTTPCDELSLAQKLSQVHDEKKDERRSVSWLSQLPDQLDVVVQERRFGVAVELIEKGNAALAGGSALFAHRSGIADAVQRRVARLTTLLVDEIQSQTLRKSEMREMLGLLLRLDQSNRAKEAFLDARSRSIKSSIRQLRFEGDIPTYIQRLGVAVFGELGDAASEYVKIFKEPEMMSSLMMWVTREVEAYGTVFRRQVFHSDHFHTMADCISVAKEQCVKLEENVGLSLTYLLDAIFLPALQEAINSHYYSKLLISLNQKLSHETWISCSMVVQGEHGQGEQVRLTESAQHLYATVQQLLSSVQRVLDLNLYPAIVGAVARLIDHYANQLSQAASTTNEVVLNDRQTLSIVANCHHIAHDLLPRVERQFKRWIGRSIGELSLLMGRINQTQHTLLSAFCTRAGDRMLASPLGWTGANLVYTVSEMSQPLGPTAPFEALVRELSNLAQFALQQLPEEEVSVLLTSVGEVLAFGIAHGPILSSDDKVEEITVAGFGQMSLDVHFLQAVLEAAGLTTGGTVEGFDAIYRIIDAEMTGRGAESEVVGSGDAVGKAVEGIWPKLGEVWGRLGR